MIFVQIFLLCDDLRFNDKEMMMIRDIHIILNNLIDTRSAGVGTGIYAGETWVRFPPKLIFTAVKHVCF